MVIDCYSYFLVEGPILAQFGRCGPDYFTMDLRWPLTPVEGFAMALSTFAAYDST